MKRCTLLLGLWLLAGCDVATVAFLMSGRDSGSSDDEAPLPAAPGPVFGEVYKVWIAMISDPISERDKLAVPEANPTSPTLTFAGQGSATAEFNPDKDPTTFNAILIQVSSEENFNLDSVEILDALGTTVVDHASGTTYWNLITSADDLLGPPDGKPAVTTATGSSTAFIFTIYPGPIERFRINARATNQPPAPGDVISKSGYPTFVNANERPGGMAIRTDGRIHLTMSLADGIYLIRYDSAGVFVDEVEVSNDLATAGSHSVALNSLGVIFTAASIQAGVIQVRRYEDDLTPGGVAGFTSTFGSDRVEHNSIAVDGSGFVIVVGGINSLLSGRNHWRVKLPDTISGSPVWQSPSNQQLDGNNPTTYWHAVTTGANDDIFTAGDRYSSLLDTNQVYSAKLDLDGDPQWADEYTQTGGAPPDVGHAIELDASGNVYVGGTLGTTAGGKEGVLLCYDPLGSPVDASGIVGAAGGDDEILDIAVDPADRSVYAVGYETVTGQGENMVIRKFLWDTQFNAFTLGWVRTHHGGFGNDRAVSCALHGTTLAVAGYETDSGGLTKLVLRTYEK